MEAMTQGTQYWPTREVGFPGFKFMTGPTFGTVIVFGPARVRLTIHIGGIVRS